MITNEELISLNKKNIIEESKKLDKSDITFLIDCLSIKNEKIRYPALLILEQRSLNFDDVYTYWNLFKNNLSSKDYFEKNIAATLICANIKWDEENKFEELLDTYFNLFNDEKPSTICMSIRNLQSVINVKENIIEKIANRVMDIDLMSIRETMRKVALVQILNLLFEIRKKFSSKRIEQYISDTLNGEILGEKEKKEYTKKL